MKYRALGSSGIQVSEISLGSWLTYSGGVERAQSIACVRRALDLGITLIDTSNIYGKGAAETVLGEALADVPRESYVLATKLYFPMTPTDRGLSRAQIETQLDASLKRLRVDHVDLYQCHRYDADTPLEETMAALTEAVRAGKTRAIGFSEWPVDRIRAALEMTGVEKFTSSQPQYSMLHRAPEAEVFPLCAANGVSQIVWSPLGQGVLTGKIQAGRGRACGLARLARDDERGVPHPVAGGVGAARRGQAAPAGGRGGPHAGPVRARLGVAGSPTSRPPSSAPAGRRQVDENAKASGAEVDPALFEAANEILAGIALGGEAPG